MTASRRVIKFTIGKADLPELESIARSRTEPVGRVERARVLLAYRQDPSFYAVGQALGMHHQKVQRYVNRECLSAGDVPPLLIGQRKIL